jgi:hypothetical protein
MDENNVMVFGAACPSGVHQTAQSFTRHQLRTLLESNSLKFYCLICNVHFPPKEEALSNLRKQVNEN